MGQSSVFRALLALHLLTGCKPESGQGGAADSGPPPSDSGGGDRSAEPETAGTPFIGEVLLADSTQSDGGTMEQTAQATFIATPSTTSGFCDGVSMVGACCFQPPADGGLPSVPAQLSAGDVTISSPTGGLIGTLSFDTDGATPQYDALLGLTWTPGAALEVAAAGGTVMAFSGMLQTPDVFSGLAPDLSGSLSIPRSTDFVVTWMPDSHAGGMVTMIIGIQRGTSTTVGAIGCGVDDSAGRMTVPASLLGNASSMDSAGIVLGRTLSTTASSPNATVTLSGSVDVLGQGTFD